MNERDARLLPRLLASLDTLEGEAEIAGAVRQVRRILGPAGIGKLDSPVEPAPAVDPGMTMLSHPSHVITTRLRQLGMNMRWLPDAPPAIAEALERVRHALIVGGQVPTIDLVMALALLPRLIATQATPAETMRNSASDLSQGLNVSMNTLNDLMRRQR